MESEAERPHIAFGIAAGILIHGSALAQTLDPNPITAEYLRGGGLAAIDADKAYRLGWNGTGTTVAVVDTGILTTHHEFTDKLPPFGQVVLNTRPWSPVHDKHGSHVAGTIAANKDEVGMHGVAYGANLLPIYAELRPDVPDPGVERISDAWQAVLNHPDITVINNSWGRAVHLEGLTTPQEIADAQAEIADLLPTMSQLRDADRLVVMAAGNESFLSPNVTAGIPFFDPTLSNNVLSVMAFDPQRDLGDIDFLADFTNLAQGAENHSILAPGTDIVSVGTASDASYTTMGGTSMATPHVSGAAAVVQSAFRWMEGKELADVLLSTTDRDHSNPANLPDVMVTSDALYEVDGTTNLIFFNPVRYASANQTDANGDYTPAALAAQDVLLDDYCATKGYNDQTCQYFKDSDRQTLDASDNPEQVFGQGVLNLGNAVGGLGFLDGNRVTDTDFDPRLGAGLYTVNTKGYSGLWSHDIGEKRANSGILDGQPLGLRKLGAGTLVLSGNNTYTGPTVAEGGLLSLTGSIVGDALVRPHGTFSGNGTVGGNLDNQGILIVGLPASSDNTLTVSNTATSSGTIVIPVGANLTGGLQAENIVLNGGVVTATATTGFLRPNSSYSGIMKANVRLTVNNDFRNTTKASPFLVVTTTTSGNSMNMDITALPLAGSKTLGTHNRPVATALDRMFTQRNGLDEQRQLDGFYSLSEDELAQIATDLQGNNLAETLVVQPVTTMINSVTHGHLNQIDVAQGLSAGDSTSLTRASAWGHVLGGVGRVKGTETLRSTLYGAVGGYDVPIDERWLVGGLAGLSRGRVRQGTRSVDIDDLRLGFYSRFAEAGWSVHGLITVSYQHYDSKRGLAVPGAAYTASSRFSGYSVGGLVDAGYNLLYGHSTRFVLRPSLGFDISHTHQNRHGENGAGLYNLNLEHGRVTQTALRPSVTFGYALGPQVNLSLSAGYRRVLSGDVASIGASLAGDASQTRFDAVGRGAGRDFGTLGVGLTANLKNGWEGDATIVGERSSRSQAIAGTLSVHYRW